MREHAALVVAVPGDDRERAAQPLGECAAPARVAGGEGVLDRLVVVEPELGAQGSGPLQAAGQRRPDASDPARGGAHQRQRARLDDRCARQRPPQQIAVRAAARVVHARELAVEQCHQPLPRPATSASA